MYMKWCYKLHNPVIRKNYCVTMHSHTSGAVIREGRQSRSLKCQESGSQIIRSCRHIILCFLLFIALAMILSTILTLVTNETFPTQFLITVGVPLLAVGVCLYHCRRVKREIGEGAAGQTSFQVPNATSTVLTLLGEDHTEPNDHQDRPERQQLTTPSAAFDPHHTAEPNDHQDRPQRQQSTTHTASSNPHHYVVVADHPKSPTQEGPEVQTPHDSLPSYDTVMKYSHLYRVPQPPSS